MAKTTFAEFSTTPADNTDINSIGVQGTNAVQNFDNAFRELMAILRRDVPGLALANTFTKTQTWTKGSDVASATSLTLGDGNYFDITGTTAITSIATKGVGTVVVLQFDGILTLTHHATDLILPGGANITTAAGDHAAFVEYASGDWRCFSYQRANGTPLTIAVQPTVDVASATTTDIGAAASENIRITGTTTITGLGTVAEGTIRFVRMAGALTLTHNGTSLILPGATNITTAANDCFIARSLGSGNWIVMFYQRASAIKASFRATKSADQTGIVPTTNTKVTFDTEEFDNGSYYDAPNSRWTPPPGIVQISASILYASGIVDQQQMSVAVFKNGSLASQTSTRASGTGAINASISYIGQANGTDYFEIFAYATGAGNKSVSSSDTQFSGVCL